MSPTIAESRVEGRETLKTRWLLAMNVMARGGSR